MSVETVSEVRAFHALESEWNDAVDRAGIGHPFLRHEWLRTWWDCFGAGRALHIVVVRSKGQIVGIAPLLRETSSISGVPLRQLRLMQNDHTPRADFIVAEPGDRVYRAIWRAVAGTSEPWDVLLLGQLPRNGGTQDAVTRLADADGCSTGVWHSSDSPYLALRGTWDAYWESLPAKFRSNVRNRMGRLNRMGEPVLESIAREEDIDRALADTIRLEASGWKRTEGTAITSDAAVRRFYTELARLAAAGGWLRLQFLSVDGSRIAASYSLDYRKRLFLLKTGYDPAFETCSPFKVLTYLATKRAYEEGFEEVDLLGDTEPWKREWTSAVRSHDWLYVFANTPRARLAYPLKFRLVPALRTWRSAL